MQSHCRLIVNHAFHGRRFDDGGLDVDVLPDLLRYKALLVDVAKELWRRNNPGRERLPKNFDEALRVKFYEVRANCATVPLTREIQQNDAGALILLDNELDDAAGLVADTIEAAGTDGSLPADFPKALLQQFREYGKSLEAEEWIELLPNGRRTSVRYDHRIREVLVRRADAAYEDAVTVIGEVTMTRISKPRMAIQLTDGREVEAPFPPEDEEKITSALNRHHTTRIEVIGRGLFTVDGQLQRITEVASTQVLPVGGSPYVPSAKPIWEEFAEALAGVPPDELAKLPVDSAERLDYYVYGGPENGR